MSDSFRIETFKSKIQDGPLYMCFVCNRCLYRCSVLQFDEQRCVTIIEGLNTGVTLS